MQLRITDYHDVSRWRWELHDDAGNFLADIAQWSLSAARDWGA